MKIQFSISSLDHWCQSQELRGRHECTRVNGSVGLVHLEMSQLAEIISLKLTVPTDSVLTK